VPHPVQTHTDPHRPAGQNMVLSLAEVAGTGWTTSQCERLAEAKQRYALGIAVADPAVRGGGPPVGVGGLLVPLRLQEREAGALLAQGSGS